MADVRLIDANALKEHLKTLEAQANNKTYENAMQDMLDVYFPKIIDSQPTIEPEERHGRWIMIEPCGTHHTHRRKCSECGEIKAQELTNFCPNCGAKMLNENN